MKWPLLCNLLLKATSTTHIYLEPAADSIPSSTDQKTTTTQYNAAFSHHWALLAITTALAAAIPITDGSSAFAERDNTRFGNAFVTDWTANKRNWIREATITLILPALNSPRVSGSALGLWPGMSLWGALKPSLCAAGIETPAGDVIQGLAISDVDNYYCMHDQGEWCIVAAAFVGGKMQYGANASASAGSKVTFQYVYNAMSSSHEQYIGIGGTVVSSISTPLNHAQKWGTAIECQTPPRGTIDAHQYLDTMVVLEAADPDWLSAPYIQGSNQDMKSADGGYTTWTADTICIDAYTFP